tara:strand:+ start:1433 stop:2341 length:909 start_codon:yes stop_codon:yes gene_type:complete
VFETSRTTTFNTSTTTTYTTTTVYATLTSRNTTESRSTTTVYSTTTTFNTTKATDVDFVVWHGGAAIHDPTNNLGKGMVFEQAVSPTSPSTISSARIRFNTQNASTVTEIYVHQNDDVSANHYNAWNNILVHVNSGNKARIVVAEDTGPAFKNRSWRITAMSYSSSGNYFTLTVDSTFAPDDSIQGSGSYSALPNLMAGDTKVSVWAWRDDNANYYTSTTTTFNTSTTTVFNTTTTYTTSKSTTTIFSTSTSRNTTESRSTEESRITSRTTVTAYSTTTFYNTSRLTFTGGGGGGGCSRGCI